MGDWITEPPQGVIQTLATVPMQATKQVEITFNCHIKEEATQLSLLFVRLRFSSRGGHGERYIGSLFRVDEPVPDDSRLGDMQHLRWSDIKDIDGTPTICITQRKTKRVVSIPPSTALPSRSFRHVTKAPPMPSCTTSSRNRTTYPSMSGASRTRQG